MWLRGWSILHTLSLDITAGALASGALAVSITGAVLPAAFWLVLPVAVWTIYTADHIADAFRAQSLANPRHAFHKRFLMPMIILSGAAGIAGGGLAFFFLPLRILEGGLIVALLAAFHLLLPRLGVLSRGKEVSAAVVYSAGIWFAPLSVVDVALESALFCLVFFFAVLLNLLMNSIMEIDLDRKENLVYLLSILAPRHAERFVKAGSVLGLLAALLCMTPEHRCEWIVLGLIAAVPGLILTFFPRTSQIYRIAGEGVYMLGFLPMALQVFTWQKGAAYLF